MSQECKMPGAIGLAKRRADLEPQRFQELFERSYDSMIARLISLGLLATPGECRKSYLLSNQAQNLVEPATLGFDVVVNMVFNDRDPARMERPPFTNDDVLASMLEANAASCGIDRGLAYLPADVRQGGLELAEPFKEESVLDTFKTITFVRRRPGLTCEEFRHVFETEHISLVNDFITSGTVTGLISYRRSYVLADQSAAAAYLDDRLVRGPFGAGVPFGFAFDLMVESVFSSLRAHTSWRTGKQGASILEKYRRDKALWSAEDGPFVIVAQERRWDGRIK